MSQLAAGPVPPFRHPLLILENRRCPAVGHKATRSQDHGS